MWSCVLCHLQLICHVESQLPVLQCGCYTGSAAFCLWFYFSGFIERCEVSDR